MAVWIFDDDEDSIFDADAADPESYYDCEKKPGEDLFSEEDSAGFDDDGEY